MPDKEEEKLRKLLDIIPKLSDFDKGYILGKGEGIMDDNRRKEASRNEIQHEAEKGYAGITDQSGKGSQPDREEQRVNQPVSV